MGGLECFSATLKALAFAAVVHFAFSFNSNQRLGTPVKLWVSTDMFNYLFD